MIKLRIDITKDIIARSANCDSDYSTNCAIALAVRDIFPNAVVSQSSLHFDSMENPSVIVTLPTMVAILPVEAKEFIRVFDRSTPERRLQMHPFSFEIDVPQGIIDRINIEEIKEIISNTPHLYLINDSEKI